MKKEDQTEQLEASQSSIKDLFSDFLNQTKGFKYQLTLKVILKKYKPKGEVGFRTVYLIQQQKQ